VSFNPGHPGHPGQIEAYLSRVAPLTLDSKIYPGQREGARGGRYGETVPGVPSVPLYNFYIQKNKKNKRKNIYKSISNLGWSPWSGGQHA
jgi:hypothetical protein